MTQENEHKDLEKDKPARISSRNVLELILAVYKMSFIYLAIFIMAVVLLLWLFNTI